jgi:hypothetical protein
LVFFLSHKWILSFEAWSLHSVVASWLLWGGRVRLLHGCMQLSSELSCKLVPGIVSRKDAKKNSRKEKSLTITYKNTWKSKKKDYKLNMVRNICWLLIGILLNSCCTAIKENCVLIILFIFIFSLLQIGLK